MAQQQKTNNGAQDDEMAAALNEDAVKSVPRQSEKPDAEVIDLADHVKPSFGAKVKNLLKNKKALASCAGAVAFGILAGVVVNSRRTTAEEPAEENTSV
jgi:hypothetical protein